MTLLKHALSSWNSSPDPNGAATVHDAGNFLGAVERVNGAWVYDDPALRDEWVNMGSWIPDADSTVTPTGDWAMTRPPLTAAEAWETMPARMPQKHFVSRRLLHAATRDTPLSEGWFGLGHRDNFVPDELRACGVAVAGGAGVLSVTLPDANAATALGLGGGRAWSSVTVTALRAYAHPIVETNAAALAAGVISTIPPDEQPTDGYRYLGLGPPVISGSAWSAGQSLSGPVAGGTVQFTGLTPGWWIARVTWSTADGLSYSAYQGRPVQVGAA